MSEASDVLDSLTSSARFDALSVTVVVGTRLTLLTVAASAKYVAGFVVSVGVRIARFTARSLRTTPEASATVGALIVPLLLSVQ